MDSFNNILKRLYNALNIKNDAEFCRIYNIKKNTLSTWKSRNKIPYELLIDISQNANININWLLTGKGEMFLSDEPKLIGINNSIVGQAGHNINGTVHIQTLTNNSSAPKTPNDEKNIQELIETFKQLPPELQDYYLNLMKAELSKYKYEQKKFSQG
jgi:phage repressor protein C with HTH and peptisase S24 domain